MNRIFSGGFDLSRVSIPGIVLMLIAVIVLLFSGRLVKASEKTGHPLSQNVFKLIALVICAGGALLAILG